MRQFNLITTSAPSNPLSIAERNMQAAAQQATFNGWKVFSIGIDADLDRIGPMEGPAFFNGYISDSFPEILDRIEAQGGELINTYLQSSKLMSFEEWYPAISGLTAESWVFTSEAEIDAAKNLSFPLFVKGDIKSSKEAGFEACLARNKDDLKQFLQKANDLPVTWRGKIIAREVLPFRQNGERNNFPLFREYRVFVYKNKIIDKGFYWETQDPFGRLDPTEEKEIADLCSEAVGCLESNLAIVDCGQLQDGSWRIVEVGDPSFCTFSHIAPASFFGSLKKFVA